MWPKRTWKKIYSPPKRMQGRAGAVRLKTRKTDCCVIELISPVAPVTAHGARIADDVYQWVGGVIASLPHRRFPLFLMDANARVGYYAVEGGFVETPESDGVGPSQRDVCTSNGERLCKLCFQQHMYLVNTMKQCGPTYSHHDGSSSRIDYIAVPQGAINRVRHIGVWQSAGERLQMIPAAGRRDHWPLLCVVDIRLCFETEAVPRFDHQLTKTPCQFNKDLLAAAANGGYKREFFLRDVERSAAARMPEAFVASRKPFPDDVAVVQICGM